MFVKEDTSIPASLGYKQDDWKLNVILNALIAYREYLGWDGLVRSFENKQHLRFGEWQGRGEFSIELTPVGFVEHTWDEHPHNGSIFNRQQKMLSFEEALKLLEAEKTNVYQKVKEKAREEAIQKITKKRLKKLGL